MENNNKYTYYVEEEPTINVKDIIIRYLFNWKWFVVSVLACVLLGYVYLKFQRPQYEVKATILIKDSKDGGSIEDELSAFEDLGIFKGKANIDNEIEILKSRSLMTKVVEELKLNVRYYSKGRPIEHERYFDTPIKITYTPSDSNHVFEGNWLIEAKNKQEFVLKDEEENVLGTYFFGKPIKVENGIVMFTTTSYFSDTYVEENFRVIVQPVNLVVDAYVKNIQIEPVNKNANAIVISLLDPLPKKAAAIIDNLIKQHSLDAIADKNEVSENTAEFINERIKFISEELSEVEGEQEDFKADHKLVDVESEAKLFLETGTESEANLLNINT